MTTDELAAWGMALGKNSTITVVESLTVPYDPPRYSGVEVIGPLIIECHPVMMESLEEFLGSQGVDLPDRRRRFRDHT